MRLVSLCPSTTETVAEIGRGADLVGVTKFCVHPAALVASLEKVGGTKDPDVARVAALAPDLVLMNREENRAEDAMALERLGLRVHASMPRSVADVERELCTLANLLEAPQAAVLAASIAERATALREQQRPSAALKYAYLIWRKPWMAAGSDTYIDDLLSIVGGVNLFQGSRNRYPTVTPSELAAADVVLLSSEPFPFKPAHADELAALTGLARQRIAFVDGENLAWHGARTLEGLAEAARTFQRLRSGLGGAGRV